MDVAAIRAAFEDVFDQAVVFHGFADHLRDYDVYVDIASSGDAPMPHLRWQVLYPGMRLVPESAEASAWSRDVGIPFHEASIETNGHNLRLIFSDLVVDRVEIGHTPFTVSD